MENTISLNELEQSKFYNPKKKSNLIAFIVGFILKQKNIRLII